MKLCKTFLTLLIGLALCAPAQTPAQILYETGFELPLFNTELPIRDQDNWEMWREGWALTISTENPRTGAQCLRIDGTFLRPTGTGKADAYCFWKSILEKTGANTPPVVEIRVDARLDGPQTGAKGTPEQDVLSANFMAVVPAANGEGRRLAGFFVSSAGKIWAYNNVPEDNGYKFSVPYTPGTYRTLALRIDFVSRKLAWSVDGTEIGADSFPASITTDQLISGYLQMFGPAEPVSTPEYEFDPANYVAYFDNYRITSIPLPTASTAIKFSQDLYLADEYARKAEVKLERTGSLEAPVRVKVVASDDTAEAGLDFEAYTANADFAVGEKTRTIEIPLLDDLNAEPDKTFKLALTELPPGASSARKETKVIIRDNERPGSIDPTWSYGIERERSVTDYMRQVSMVEQPDGRIVATFFIEGQVAGNSLLVRLNRDGAKDPSFKGELRGSPAFVSLLPDGKLMLVENVEGVVRMRRLNSDGSPDETFRAEVEADLLFSEPPDIGLPDGRMLVWGASWVEGFRATQVNGTEMPDLIRLNNDGTHDPAFSAPADLQPSVVRRLPDGKILVGTGFSKVPVYRLNENGSVDSTFQPATVTKGANEEEPYLTSLVVQPDGKIIIAGQFHQLNGKIRNSLARLNADGTVDESFNTGAGFTTGGKPAAIEARLLPGGHIIISPHGTSFDKYDGQDVPRFSIRAPFNDNKAAPILLNPDGSRNLDFAISQFIWQTDAAGPALSVPIPVGVAGGMPLFSTGWGLGRLNVPQPATEPQLETPGTLDSQWASTLGLPARDIAFASTVVFPLPDGKLIAFANVYDQDFNYPLREHLVRLNGDGSIDATFPIRTALPSNPNGGHFLDPRAVAMPDGGLLVWDSESDGGRSLGYRFRWRIKPDGSLDERWPKITSPSGGSFQFTPQPDGKVLVSDDSSPIFLNDELMPWLFRLNNDGALDTSFTAATNVKGQPTLLPDGKILLAPSANGSRLFRLNGDGSQDLSFQMPASVNPSSYLGPNHLKPLADGKLLVAAVARFYRLNQDGSIDSTFATGTVGLGVNDNTRVERIEVLGDGKILLLGYFKSYNGVAVNGIARLESDGALETSFLSGTGFGLSILPNTPAILVGSEKVWLLPEGRLLISGSFDSYDGQKATPPLLLNADGTRDASFSATKIKYPWGLDNPYVLGVIDGRPIVMNGQGIGRLNMPRTAPVDTEISFSQDIFLADEQAGTATAILTRARSLDVPVTVRITPSDDTAKVAEDYLAGPIEVKFNAGETNKVVPVPLAPDDARPEMDKVFKLTLANLPAGAASARKETKVIIRDNERPGSIDSNWSGSLAGLINPDQFATVIEMSPRPDGKIDLAYSVGRRANPEGDPVAVRWVRLNADGSRDESFAPRSHNGTMEHFVPSTDGKWLVVQGVANSVQMRLTGRVNADGSRDASFSGQTTSSYNSARQMVIPLANGKTLVSDGSVQQKVIYNGRSLLAPIRLNHDGSLDETFQRGDLGGLNKQYILALAPQPNGQVLVQMSDNKFHRLNVDGSLDQTFAWNFQLTTENPPPNGGAINFLNPMLPQSDGKVVLYGHFQRFNGREVNSIVRINPDGSIDTGFGTGGGFANQDGQPSQINGLIPLPGGRLLFTSVRVFDSQTINGELVLNADGSRWDAFALSPIDLSILGFQEPMPPTQLIAGSDGRIYFDTLSGLGRLNLNSSAEDAPQLSIAREVSGGTRLTLKVKAGRRYTLQSSSDLRAWTDLKSETASGDVLEFIDTPTQAARFYRARHEP